MQTMQKEVGVETRVPAENIKGLLLFNGVYNFDTAGECNFPFYKNWHGPIRA